MSSPLREVSRLKLNNPTLQFRLRGLNQFLSLPQFPHLQIGICGVVGWRVARPMASSCLQSPTEPPGGASAQKSAVSRWRPGGRVAMFLEYSEPPGFQVPRDPEGWSGCGVSGASGPCSSRRSGAAGSGDSGARPQPPFSQRGAHGLGNPRTAGSIFTRARLKIVAALGAEPEIAAPRKGRTTQRFRGAEREAAGRGGRC